MKYALAVLLTLFTFGCDTSSVNNEVDTEKQEGRIKILSDQVYSDSLGSGRVILVLFDTVSGKEFIAISGLTIVEN